MFGSLRRNSINTTKRDSSTKPDTNVLSKPLNDDTNHPTTITRSSSKWRFFKTEKKKSSSDYNKEFRRLIKSEEETIVRPRGRFM